MIDLQCVRVWRGAWVTIGILVAACGTDRRTPPSMDSAISMDSATDSMVDAAAANDTDSMGLDSEVSDSGSDAGGPDADPSDASPVDAASDTAVDSGSDDDAGGADAGSGTAPQAGELVIVEIQGNPQRATDEEAEYIEVINVSARTLDLDGVVLTHLDWMGGEPDRSVGRWTVDERVDVGPGERALLVRSSGGFFGGAAVAHVYGDFVFDNGDVRSNRIRMMVPGWDGTEPPASSSVIDQVIVPVGGFDNPLRARAWTLMPSIQPNAATNDNATNWCYAANTPELEYRTLNWGTPGSANRCD